MAYSSKLDLNDVAEDKLSDFVNSTVHDSTFSPNTTNKAKKSLPKKLILKPTNATHNDMGVWAQKLIPKGTRFGPIVGEMKPVKVDSNLIKLDPCLVGGISNAYTMIPEDLNKTWNVFPKPPGQAPFVIDVRDILKSNWMRFVQFAENKEQQNLVAYQDESDIFFLATKDIQKDEELAVWYCKEFAARVDKPETPVYISSETSQLAQTIKTLVEKSKENQKEELIAPPGRENESDSGYAGSADCDQNESDENSYSENEHDCSKSCNANSFLDSEKNSHAQASSETGAAVIDLQRDLNVDITPGSKYIKLRSKSFFESIFYCIMCKSGTGLFMGEGKLVHHFQVACKTCDITFHGFHNFYQHLIYTHKKSLSSNQIFQLFEEWSKDFIEDINGHGEDVITKVLDVVTKGVGTSAKAFREDKKASDIDTKGSDLDTKASDVDIKPAYVDSKETEGSAKESVLNMLFKRKEFLRRDIAKKRANLEKQLKLDIGKKVDTIKTNLKARAEMLKNSFRNRSSSENRGIALERTESYEKGEICCGLNIEMEAIDEKIEPVENLNDSQVNGSNSLLKHENMDEKVKRSSDEVKRKGDRSLNSLKINPYRQEIDDLQQSHRDIDNMIEGKVEELNKCCQLSSIDCQNVNIVYEQEIEALKKGVKEKSALFSKLDSTQKEDLTDHVMVANVDEINGQHQVHEMKKERKRGKTSKPYCARASCPNKGRHRCSRCLAVFYCHEDCLTEDWPHHKTFCDYVYQANKCPQDSNKKETLETQESGTREEVD